jgi:multicomponent Na+:H+ antiporter subunit G
VVNYIAIIFILFGFFFVSVAAIGVLRLPDFYTRMHASGKSETLGVMLTLIGFVIYNGFNLVSLKILLISLFILLANPIGTHAITRAAFYAGIKPWKKGDK